MEIQQLMKRRDRYVTKHLPKALHINDVAMIEYCNWLLHLSPSNLYYINIAIEMGLFKKGVLPL